MFGGGAQRREVALPRLVQLRVQSLQRRRPRAGSPNRFLVSVHLEASVLTWQSEVTVPAATEETLMAAVADLHGWSTGLGLVPDVARARVHEIGAILRDEFIGEGTDIVDSLRPTALLLEIDETIIGLPWELVLDRHDRTYSVDIPTGRVVTTRDRPETSRDPLADDAELTILVVVPESDLVLADEERHVIESLPRQVGTVDVTVETLVGRDATRRRLAGALADRSVEIVHIAGHGAGGDRAGVKLTDGWLRPKQIAALSWAAPPYFVFASACESARVAPGSRLLERDQTGSLPSAFLARGVEAYAGHYWPVGDAAAARFAEVFYITLFEELNVGVALHTARQALQPDFDRSADLGGLGTIFFGDVGTAHRAHLAEAV